MAFWCRDRGRHSIPHYWLHNRVMSTDVINGLQLALRSVLALIFIGAGIAHFLPSVTRTMAAMIPPRLRVAGPFNPANLVLLTGVCEIAGGLGLLLPPTKIAAGIALIVFLAAVFPAKPMWPESASVLAG